ncbi:uncharacterized protein LOC100184807 [Ciona intestinalis]
MRNKAAITGVFVLLYISSCVASNSSAAITTTATTFETTLAITENQCLNGGTCLNSTLGTCNRCGCILGYGGPTCATLLVRIDGTLSYNDFLNVSNIVANTTALQRLLTDDLNTTVILTSPVVNGNLTTISYTTYANPNSSWVSPNFVNDLVARLRLKYATPVVVNAVFGPSSRHALNTFIIDVDECKSGLNSCNPLATCVNLSPSFKCKCFTGYVGDGMTCAAITCKQSAAPIKPSLATKTVYYPNNTVMLNPSEIVGYQTVIRYTCSKRYSLHTVSGGTSALIIACGSFPKYKNTNWSGVEVTCNMDLAFRVAIIAAAVSGLIIVLMLGCFITQWCLKRERKARGNSSNDQEVLQFENHVFDD